MSDTRAIEKKTKIKADAQAVWRALTDAEEITRWFAPQARVEPGPKGRILLSWGPGMEGDSPIRIWEPASRLQVEMGTSSKAQTPLTIDYFLEGRGGETTLRLVHSGFSVGAEWDGEYDAYDRGWEIYVRNLKHYLERHPGERCLQSAFTAKSALSREDAWGRVLQSLGFQAKGPAPKEGDAFRLGDLEGALEIFAPARDLAGTVPSLDDGLLRLSFEAAGTGTWVYGVLLTYGEKPADTRALAEKLERVVRKALPMDGGV